MNIDHKNALPRGYKLQEYRIDAVLGHGGFDITYQAIDVYLEKPVAIKEYLPEGLAVRVGQTTVVAKSNTDEDVYQWGLRRFLAEAKILAKFKHPNIVRVLRVIEAHNTAYQVMDFEEGQSLGDYLENHGPALPENEIRNIFLPILDGLRAVHEAGLLHRDIKPYNIFLRNDSSPMLINFDAARYPMDVKSDSLIVIFTPGYAPFEQYSSKGKQGPWTDIYGIGASMYRCMTGAVPPDASDRSTALLDDESDPYAPAGKSAKLSYSRELLAAVDAALAFRVNQRPQSARAFQKMLAGGNSRLDHAVDQVENVAVDEPKINSVSGSDEDAGFSEQAGSFEIRKIKLYILNLGRRAGKTRGTLIPGIWIVFSLAFLLASSIFFDAQKIHLFRWNDQATGVILGCMVAIATGLILALKRRKVLNSVEISLYSIGCSLAVLLALVFYF